MDPDSIPVCSWWIHWSVANLPIDALMYDFNDSHALAIPLDFSRQLPAMIPETVQGATPRPPSSWAAALTGGDHAVTTVRSRRTRIMSTTCRCGPPK